MEGRVFAGVGAGATADDVVSRGGREGQVDQFDRGKREDVEVLRIYFFFSGIQRVLTAGTAAYSGVQW